MPATTSRAKTTATVSENGATHPACSAEVEDWLRSRDVEFSPCKWLPMDKIRRRESRANQARREALVPEVVERYVTALRHGEKFPPIVVVPQQGGYLIVDGNHRDEAHLKVGRESILGYVLDEDTPSGTIDLLMAEANVRHGLPTDNEWRSHQAAYLIANGADAQTVAKATGLSKPAVETAMRAQRGDLRAGRMGIRGWDKQSQITRASLSTLKSDPVFQAMAEVVCAQGLSGQGLKDALARVKAASSETEALRIVGEVEEDITTRRKAAGGKRRLALQNPRMRFLTALGAVMNLNPDEAPRLFRTDRERAEVRERADNAAMVLMELAEALK